MSQNRTADVMLAWCAPAQVTTLFADSLAHLYEDDRARDRIAGHLTYLGGPNLPQSRTVVTRAFLDSGAPWLLQIDSDMVFSPDDFLTLLGAADAQQRPILGGFYTGVTPHDGNAIPVAARLRDGELDVVRDAPAGQVVDVDFIGTGFLLVHRSVFVRMLQDRPGDLLPWWACTVEHGEVLAEDYTFCSRARKAGYRVGLHGGVRLGHVKTATVHVP